MVIFLGQQASDAVKRGECNCYTSMDKKKQRDNPKMKLKSSQYIRPMAWSSPECGRVERYLKLITPERLLRRGNKGYWDEVEMIADLLPV